MVALKGTSDIGDQINKKIIAVLADANKLSDLPDFNDPTRLGIGKEMVERLTKLIAIFENKALDFSKKPPTGKTFSRTPIHRRGRTFLSHRVLPLAVAIDARVRHPRPTAGAATRQTRTSSSGPCCRCWALTRSRLSGFF